MIWLVVFRPSPSSTSYQRLAPTLSPVVRTFVLATIAGPIVIYALMPELHGARGRLLADLASTS